jgi:hypothetical protein
LRAEAIRLAVHLQSGSAAIGVGRNGLPTRRELTACLRTGRALRVPRARNAGRGKSFVTPEVLISERPAEATHRAVPGHWEGDLILWLNRSAIGTLMLEAAARRLRDRGELAERLRASWPRRGSMGLTA